MGLMAHLPQRARTRAYVWRWRLRYWWIDTESGERARIGAFAVAVLVLVAQIIRMAVVALLPQDGPGPQQAVYWWVVQLVIMIVAAAISYALRPKVEPPQDQQHTAPTVEDGTAARDYFGTHWIDHDDNFLLAWKIVGRDGIYTKGGKK